jgi:DtxR family manganese transport transcriptional regulator
LATTLANGMKATGAISKGERRLARTAAAGRVKPTHKAEASQTAAMPEEPTQAQRFGKARYAQSVALLEDYVELIADLLASRGEARATDVAKRLGVTHPTALKSIARLKREGLATALPYRGIFLTDAGHELANRVRIRHRLIVELLIAVGVPTEAAEADAEGMEHHASKATLDAFAQYLARKK